MEEIINSVEQFSDNETCNSLDTREDNMANDTVSEDSTFGKFRDAKSLLDAYNNLQSEFTRKSQRLAEYEKNIGTKQDKSCSPIYERDDWHERLGTFLDTHSDAKKYSSEIASIILEDKDIANSDNSLELAWLKVMSNHYKDPNSLNEKEINDYLSSHKDIKDKIIKEYIDNCKTTRPVTLMSGKGESVTSNMKFDSLEDAGEYVKQLFTK